MSNQQPGIRVSLSDQIITPDVSAQLQRLNISALEIVQSLNLVRYIVKDIDDVMQGDLKSIFSLLTNIILLIARLSIATKAVIAKNELLLAQQVLMRISTQGLVL